MLDKRIAMLVLPLVLISIPLAYIATHQAGEGPDGKQEGNVTGGNLSYKPVLRRAAVAGYFYPDDAGQLREVVREYLSNAGEASCPPEAIGGLLVPHAGYAYSGRVAAWAYKQLEDRGDLTVVLVGPSHYHDVKGASVFPCGWYSTPLGDVEVDSELALELIEALDDIGYDPEAHEREHSLEVQLPFLQEVLTNFMIVPMTINQYDPKLWKMIAKSIANCCCDRKVLLIASSDLSHYHPRSVASVLDQRVMDSVDSFDPVGLQLKARSGACELCGLAAVETVMMACQEMGYDSSMILRYGDSADSSGDTSAVVGYLSAAFYKPSGSGENEVDAESREELVKLARSSIKYYLETGDSLPYETSKPVLHRFGGAFVTLRKGGELRGCVGYTLPEQPLWQAVADAAVQAACNDPRFPSLSLDELEDVTIEISLLSRLEMVLDPEEIKVGRDGLYIVGQGRSGLLLPQFAVENGWDRDQFLAEICRKAGLQPNSWKTSELYAFSAQVFGEQGPS